VTVLESLPLELFLQPKFTPITSKKNIMLNKKSALVPKNLDGERFDLAAVSLFPEISRKKIKLIVDSGGAYINKKRIQIAKYAVKQNDKIELFWDEIKQPSNENIVANKKTAFQSFVTDKNIIFENEQFFIINKPAGIASQATLTSSTDTIFHMLAKLNPQKFKLAEMFMVHRLDKDTSGILIVARNKVVQKKFEDLFREKKVTKTYNALCFQVPQKPTGLISFPIAKDNSKPNCYFAITNAKAKLRDAKEAQTEYKCLQNFKNEASHVVCNPKTGRTHQIRVHLAAIGCPILGDKTYSQNIYGHRFAQIAMRHMLHATSIEFEFENKKFQFTTAFPEDFAAVLKLLEAGN